MSKIPTFTKEEYDQFASAIEDGSYFAESRRFYSVIYMSIMPERCLYIVLTSLAVVTAFMALLSLAVLLPLKPAKPILFGMEDVTKNIPLILELRTSPYQPVNEALQDYFLRAYVKKREDYSFDTIQSSFRFLRLYSSDAMMNAYRKYIDPTSPRSPINRYEKNSRREVEVTKVVIKRADGEKEDDYLSDRSYIATVSFTAEVINPLNIELSYWQAQVVFDYVPLKMTQPKDQVNGKLKVDPMGFRVTDYTAVEVPEEKE
jgi:type IV secretory pathway component VirB8